MYSRDSFDRFGDDLCQLIISYLPIEEKFMCESVCRQWQQLIYLTQTELIIDSNIKYLANSITIEKILQKCPNITIIDTNKRLLPDTRSFIIHILKYCHQLVQFKAYLLGDQLNDELLDQFMEKFGKQLHIFEVMLSINQSEIKNWFDMNANKYTNLCPLIVDGKHFLLIDMSRESTTKQLDVNSLIFDDQNLNSFQTITENYCQNIRSITIVIRDFADISTNSLFDGLSQMSSLFRLKLHYIRQSTDALIAANLQQIGANCPHIKTLVIVVLNTDLQTSSESYTRTLATINRQFLRLKRLDFKCYNSGDFVVTSQSLNCLQQLTHLSIGVRNNYGIDDQFFVDIHQHLPRIQYLRVFNTRITGQAFISLCQMKHLRIIRLYNCHIKSIEANVDKFINCSKSIVKVSLNNNFDY